MPATFKDEIRIEPKGFDETMKALGKLDPDLQEAVRETVRLAIPFAMDEAVKQILNRYQMSEASLMDQSSRHGRWKMKPKFPTGSNLSGGVMITGTRMPVMRFSVTPTSPPNQLGLPVAARTPVTVQILRSGGIQSGAPNVFLARMKSGHIGVYRRKYPNPGGPRRIRPDGQKTQLPITEEYMLSVPEMLAGKKLKEKFQMNLDNFVGKTLKEELAKVSLKAWATAALRI